MMRTGRVQHGVENGRLVRVSQFDLPEERDHAAEMRVARATIEMILAFAIRDGVPSPRRLAAFAFALGHPMRGVHTQRDLAKQLGCTPARVSVLITEAKNYLRNHKPDAPRC